MRSSPRACSTRRARTRSLRALQLGWFTTPLLLDEDADIAQALERVDGLDVDGGHRRDRRRPTRSPAYEDDKQQTRSAEGGPTDFQGKARQTDGPVRYSAPSLVFHSDAGLRLEAGGFQTVEAYDVLVANLDPTLERQAPPEDAARRAAPVSRRARHAEVAAIMTQNNQLPDRDAAERALIELAGAGERAPRGARRRRALAARSREQRRAGVHAARRSSLRRRARPATRRRRVASSAAMSVTVTLPDGNAARAARRRHRRGRRRGDRARARARGAGDRGERRARGRDDGASREVRDLARPLPDGAQIAILTDKSGPSRRCELIRHDAAHVLAAAVIELYPGVKISIGPPIEDGFYYDFEFPEGVAVSEADFPQIEARMRAHVKAAEPFERQDVPSARPASASSPSARTTRSS